MAYLTDGRGGVLLDLYVVPRSSRTECAGLHGERLRIRLQAPPAEGKANRALLRLLAETLSVPASSLRIVSGQTGRRKRVLVEGLDAGTVRKRIGRVEG
jgi:uncharacterized protein (TIGR00251 family)